MKVGKFVLAILLATLSMSSFAAVPTGAMVSCVNVPCFHGGLTFGLTGLYIQPLTPHIDYAVIFPFSTSLTIGGRFQNADPDYNLGWGINVGYVFPCTGNDITLAYADWNNSLSDSILKPTGGQLLGTIISFVPNVSATIVSASGKYSFDYHAVDLDFGQYLNLSCRFRMRLFGGLRYADMEHRLRADYAAVAYGNLPGDKNASFTENSQFWGVGPRFGAYLSYHLGNGFGLVGRASSTLLIGSQETHFNSYLISLTGTPPVIVFTSQSFKYHENNCVVPDLEARLGLDYSYQFCNCQRTKLTMEVGYMVDHYFNTVERVGTGTIIEPDDLIRHTIDTSFDGPYLQIQVNI